MRTSVFTRLLQSEAVSTRTALWFSIVAVLSVVFGLPNPNAVDPLNIQWWVVAAVSQLLFLAVLALFRVITSRLAPEQPALNNLGVLVLTAVSRAIALAFLVELFQLDSSYSFAHPMRLIPTVVMAVVWMSALGLIFQSSHDYKVMYEQLLIQQAQFESTNIDIAELPEVLERWSTLRERLDMTVSQAQDLLDDREISDEESLHDAAKLIGLAVDSHVRPISHGYLKGVQSTTIPNVPFLASVKEVLNDWRAPVLPVTVFTGISVAIASVSRAGFVGLTFAAEYVVVLLFSMVVTNRLVRKYPDQSLTLSIIQLVGFPIIFFSLSVAIGQGIFHVTPDFVGALIVGLQASAIMLTLALMYRMNWERQVRLDHMRLQIDDRVIELLSREEAASRATVDLGLFVHHSVQSELTSVAMRLVQAASTGDPRDMQSERIYTKLKLDQLGKEAPWITPRSGKDHIAEVVDAWKGIANIQLSFSFDLPIDARSWQTLAYVIEESATNAIRSGKAKNLWVDAHVRNRDLEILVRDDGSLKNERTSRGAGSLWLDRVAPEAWQLSSDPDGTSLFVRIPIVTALFPG